MEENNNDVSKNTHFDILWDWTVRKHSTPTNDQPMTNPSKKKENEPDLKRTHAVCDQPTQRLNEECDVCTISW